jgi:hypothetical protein
MCRVWSSLFSHHMMPSQHAHAVMRACVVSSIYLPVPVCFLHRLLRLALAEQRLVLLLSLDESLLEAIGVYTLDISMRLRAVDWEDSLSLLAKRIARVCASGSPSLTSAAAFQTQLRSLPTLGDSFMSGTTARLLVCIAISTVCVSYRSGWRTP